MSIFNINLRKLIIIFVGVLLLVSALGVQKAFTYPSQVEEEVVLLDYQHRGEFDYVAHLKGSYLNDDIPLEESPFSTTQTADIPESPQSNPKYPLEHVETIDMSYTYSFVPDQEIEKPTSTEIEITASIVKTGTGREDITLLPVTGLTGDFTVKFTLIGEELAEATSVVITADTYTTVIPVEGEPFFESYSQTMTISPRGQLIEMSGLLSTSKRAALGEYSYEQTGEFDYSVQFKADSPFGAIELTPPSVSVPEPPQVLSSMTVKPGEPLFYKLFEDMDLTFSYQLESDSLLRQVSEDISLTAVLENPGVWRKEFPLVPYTSKAGDFVVSFSLSQEDLNYYNNVYKVIEREIGMSSSHNLTILADVYVQAESDHGAIAERFSQTLSTTLEGDILTWKEGVLVQSQGGNIRTSRMIPNPGKVMGLPVGWARGLSILLTVMLLILLSYLVVLYIWYRPEEASPLEKEILRASKKHKDVIVDVKELPTSDASGSIIQLSSLDQLVKTADDLLKPVLHGIESGIHTYCVVDGSVRYQYVCDFSV